LPVPHLLVSHGIFLPINLFLSGKEVFVVGQVLLPTPNGCLLIQVPDLRPN